MNKTNKQTNTEALLYETKSFLYISQDYYNSMINGSDQWCLIMTIMRPKGILEAHCSIFKINIIQYLHDNDSPGNLFILDDRVISNNIIIGNSTKLF